MARLAFLRKLAMGLVAAGLLAALPEHRLAAQDMAAQDMDAQDMAALVANSVRVDAAGQLVAEGGVEVFYKGRTLRASRIVYDRTQDRLTIDGPIVMVDGDTAILVARQADLSADLTEGVLQSARLVLNRELQLAASQILRVGGRYTQLENAVASSCKICAGAKAPLWEIRARRILHDQQERQIYFDHAQFRVGGVPVIYFPRLRMPDPTIARSNGFLLPSVRTTSGLGAGVKLPYFLTIGPHRDLTITPYLSSKSGRTVELRYRQAFSTGEIELNGALSRDAILPGETRHYLTAIGSFDLPRDFELRFDGIVVSDPSYLLDYGLPDYDRLHSEVMVSRTRRNEYIAGRLIGISSIRADEVNSSLPTVISDFTFHRRFSGGVLGGETGLRFQTHAHYRSSQDPNDSAADLDTIADGRDVARASLRLDWRRNWTLPWGMVASTLAEVTTDAYRIAEDARFGGSTTRSHPAVAVELRWPWAKTAANGVGHVIEPVAQFVWSPKGTETLPNEDSILVEFDEGNLFALNRYPGSDAVERGARLNLGLAYTRVDPAGWTLGAAAGRVLRSDDQGQFSAASGLDGKRSDWLIAAQLTLPQGLGLTQRLLMDDDLSLTKSETRLNLSGERYGLTGSYVFLSADTAEDRPADIAEIAFDGSYKMTESWTASAGARYDIEANRTNRAALGLRYRNECVLVDLSLSRRFTSSTNVTPTTDFGLSVDLVGFGSGGVAGPSRVCRR
ncbi:MAG: LPS-assembly protein LptD [Rhodobacteraceae bacterium]|nr:LPS-assembly protein LptD [Paracoccaceae bacterium]